MWSIFLCASVHLCIFLAEMSVQEEISLSCEPNPVLWGNRRQVCLVYSLEVLWDGQSTCVCLGFSSQAVVQDGLWAPSLSGYRPLNLVSFVEGGGAAATWPAQGTVSDS